MITTFYISEQPGALLHFLSMDAPQRNTVKGLVFILTVSGQAIVEVDGCSYTLLPGGLLTLLPSHLLYTVSQSSDYGCLTIAFPFDAMTDFPYLLPALITEKMEQTPFILLSAEERRHLAEGHTAILHHYHLVNHPSYKEILCALIYVFTAEVSAIYANHPMKATATHREELTENFFRLLHEYFSSRRDVAFYADCLCITPKYLARVIQQVTGHTPAYWIADFTVREAKTLLKSTTLTVTELSERMNFPNSSFFARYFRRHAGVSPQEYRAGKK
ncbi:helix-turn-helix domain-containing protein [uncultured Bacteroides sp.]|uniref:helix-turn-helix domain-containing protein n=1 Tax=uncultured Bacteroides sp. TaxID=162156 RepID=UPI00280AEFF0|nr:helix-turn-helix domain-containing protein [uncultured Bacteroides sp.]